MIRIICNLWRGFRALILAIYIFHIALREFYNYRNSYIGAILSRFKEPDERFSFFLFIRAVIPSAIAAYQGSLKVLSDNPSLSVRFYTIIGVAWFSEKIGINIKVSSPGLDHLFENLVLTHSQKYQFRDNKQFRSNAKMLLEIYAKTVIPSEYGYKVISKLAIKGEFSSQADEWAGSNLQGDWIAVHYRGSDRKVVVKHRLIEKESYIAYLKEVLDDHCNIFACSDQAQFIDQIKGAFPGRVFCREIVRSQDGRPLHMDTEYYGAEQMKDALMDILILSKAKLIYTTGSWFVDVVRFFNPSVKIISLSRCSYHRKIDNFISVPKAHLISIDNRENTE